MISKHDDTLGNIFLFSLGSDQAKLLKLKANHPQNSCFLSLKTSFESQSRHCKVQILLSVNIGQFVVFNSTTHCFDGKSAICLFNKTCAANGNAFCPATFPLVTFITHLNLDGLAESSGKAGKQESGGE
jgi:hypothetical protein